MKTRDLAMYVESKRPKGMSRNKYALSLGFKNPQTYYMLFKSTSKQPKLWDVVQRYICKFGWQDFNRWLNRRNK